MLNLVNILLKLLIVGKIFADLRKSVHGRGVVPTTQLVADSWVGGPHLLAHEVHNDLARMGQSLLSAMAQNVRDRNIKIGRNDLD